MSFNSLALTSSRNWGAGNGHEASSSDDHNHHQIRNNNVPWPLYPRPEGGSMYAPWRLFEERVRTGPYGLTRFPSQPYSPIRILVLDGGSRERVDPRVRQFIRDSPPRIRGDWHLGAANQEREDPSLTDEEFKKAMKKLRKQVYNPTYPRRRAWKRGGLFGNRSSNKTANNDTEEADEKSESKDCTICLEAFVPNQQVLVTPCNHMFHNDCLIPWVKARGQCPVCRFMLCEKSTLARINNNINNNVSNIDIGMPRMGEDDLATDLIFLIRAMEEAFNWVNLSR